MDTKHNSDRTWDLRYLDLEQTGKIHYQLSPAELVEEALRKGEGVLTDTGALAVSTGEFTGRSPEDRFIVFDEITSADVWWGDVNIKFDPEKYDALYGRVSTYLKDKEIYIRDAAACADREHQISVRVITETAFQSLFAHNLFINPQNNDPSDQPEWTIIAVPGFRAVPSIDGTRRHNFSIINFTRRTILIGGTAYTGEIKKGIFSVLNFLLPRDRAVLSMHCSANGGPEGDTAIFFGLSGTGKTTLSADPGRMLIGDDEHGWSENGVFNFEGGCYAKCVDLSPEKEPQIFRAVKFGALLENTRFFAGTRNVDYSNTEITENTRVAYPLNYIENAVQQTVAPPPKNIFFLTADAFGVLPAISKLSKDQAMYHFMSGYTAKVAGTEAGVKEPKATFSACFGKAFLPLHPGKYAALLGNLMERSNANVWLINTGWTGGPYGTGTRMELTYTRAMLRAALGGELDTVAYSHHPVFGLAMPVSCPGVPKELLNPKNTWANAEAYDQQAARLAEAFVSNFKQYQDLVDPELLKAAPHAIVYV